MTQAIEAIYENGVFRPLGPVHDEIADGDQVTLFVQPDIVALAGKVYEGLSEEEIEELEKHFVRRPMFRERSEPLFPDESES